MNDEERLLSIIEAAPFPGDDKTDSELAQEYRNWYYGVRSDRLEAAKPTTAGGMLEDEILFQKWWAKPRAMTKDNVQCRLAFKAGLRYARTDYTGTAKEK